MVTKADLHEMVDKLKRTELATAALLLAKVHEDPLWAALQAVPFDDEPGTAEDIAAIERGRADIRAGRVKSLEQVKQELLGE